MRLSYNRNLAAEKGAVGRLMEKIGYGRPYKHVAEMQEISYILS